MNGRPQTALFLIGLVVLGATGAGATSTLQPFASSYLGGSGSEIGWAVDVGPDGYVYAAGTTTSTDFPGAGTTLPRGGEVFVTKIKPDGTGIVWSRLLGGSLYDFATGIRATSDAVYVAGSTASLDFPTTNGAFDRDFGGSYEGFLVKLDLQGATQWATLLGGSALEEIHAIELAPDGKVIVGGATTSCDFFVSATAAQRPPTGCSEHAGDAFVSRFTPSGAMHMSTVYGGTGADDLKGLGVDGVSGAVFLTGTTDSTDLPLPGTPYQTRADDVFVAKLDPSLERLAYSTYLGGSNGQDTASDIDRDRAGNAYVTGATLATNFPATAGAYRTTHQSPTGCDGPCSDAFVVKLNAAGSGLVWSTYLGGGGPDEGAALGLGPDEAVWIAGPTQSGASFVPPGTGGGFNDGYLAVLEPAGNALRHIATLGGNDEDEPFHLRVVAGQAWTTGFTYSPDFPTNAGALDRVRSGTDDGFVTGFDVDPTPPSIAFDHRAGNEWWVEAIVTGPAVASVQARDDGAPWTPLERNQWGVWAGSFHVEPGHRVQFRALSEAQWVESCWFTHPQGIEQCPDPGQFAATFLNPRGNEWWIETDVSANQAVTRVEVKLNGGASVAMAPTDWGSWAKSLHAPAGTIVQFAAFGAGEGGPVSSACYRWTDAAPTACPSSTPPSFDHKAGNEWWVEALVTGPTATRVQSMDTGGLWTELTLRDWGAWAGSFHIEPGHDVKFRALVANTWYESCWFTHPQGAARTGGATCAGTAT